MTELGETERELLARLVDAQGGKAAIVFVPDVDLDVEVERLAPGAILVAVGAPGASLHAAWCSLAGRTYASLVRLVPSEVLAVAGGAPIAGAIASDRVREVIVAEARTEDDRALVLPQDLVSDRFSIEAYAALLRRALDDGYEFVGFEAALELERSDPRRVVLLRHDIDLSPVRALRMAEVEAQLGVRSTFFFMLSGAFYDLLEPHHRHTVRDVAALGHEVGFHYDEYDDIVEGLDILSAVAGRTVRHVAQHNPTILPRRGFESAKIVDAYDARITGAQGFTYVSDSGMRWRKKTLADLLGEGASRIYALCHPETWLSEGRDLLSTIRSIEAEEDARRRRRYDAFVAGNIRYLRTRKQQEGR